VLGMIWSRFSHAASMAVSSCAFDMFRSFPVADSQIQIAILGPKSSRNAAARLAVASPRA